MCHEWYDGLALAELLRLGEQNADELTRSSGAMVPKHELGKEQKADIALRPGA